MAAFYRLDNVWLEHATFPVTVDPKIKSNPTLRFVDSSKPTSGVSTAVISCTGGHQAICYVIPPTDAANIITYPDSSYVMTKAEYILPVTFPLGVNWGNVPAVYAREVLAPRAGSAIYNNRAKTSDVDFWAKAPEYVNLQDT